jgi:putative transposase
VFMEDLRVKNMSASAKGTHGKPGVNVKAKSGLNKSILDQGWSTFRTMLEYKMAWSGGQLVLVSPQYTSQTCPRCSHVSKENRKTQDTFRCVSCGYKQNADLVGALNVLRVGLTRSACQVNLA